MQFEEIIFFFIKVKQWERFLHDYFELNNVE